MRGCVLTIQALAMKPSHHNTVDRAHVKLKLPNFVMISMEKYC